VSLKANDLRDALLAVAEMQKTNFLMIQSMLAELVALRETVRGLDPSFSEVMEHRRLLEWETNGEVVRPAILVLDRVIQRLSEM
jgi:hypothetical protein